MSLSNLYEIESLADDRAVVRLNASHPLYRGHFPGNPITPGVVLMQLTTDMLSRITHQKLAMRTVQNVKFRKPIGPSATVAFVFNKVSEADGQLSAKVSVEVDGAVHARMSLIYDVAAQ